MLNWGIFFFLILPLTFFYFQIQPPIPAVWPWKEGRRGKELVKEGEKGGLQTFEELSGLNSEMNHADWVMDDVMVWL